MKQIVKANDMMKSAWCGCNMSNGIKVMAAV